MVGTSDFSAKNRRTALTTTPQEDSLAEAIRLRDSGVIDTSDPYILGGDRSDTPTQNVRQDNANIENSRNKIKQAQQKNTSSADANKDSTMPLTSASPPITENTWQVGDNVDDFSNLEEIGLNNGIRFELKNFSIEDNVLNQFEQYAYFFRFFISSEIATAETITHEPIIVIAETGSTGYNINDVEIKNVISPSSTTRNAIATEISFKITEPFGSSLLDQIRNAAISLGVKDHRDAPLWLELSFRGYNGPDENSYEGGQFANEVLGKETRRWKLKIKDFEAEINHGATEYSVTAVPSNEESMYDSARRLEKDIKVTGSTVSSFLGSLAKQMNTNSNSSTASDIDIRSRTRQYSFELPLKTFPTFGNWELRGDNISDLKRSENFEVVEKGGAWEFAFSSGTAIEAILHIMISVTNEGQSYMRYGENRSGAALKFDDTKNIEKPFIMFRVEPRTEILTYNTIANKYDTLNIYHIVPYKTHDAVGSREEIVKAKDKLNSKRRLLNVLKNGGFKKRYDYIFTGLNTEIIDYSIKFDRAWFISLPIFQGQNRGSVLSSSGNMDPIKNGYRIVQSYGASVEGTLKTLQEKITKVEAQLDEDNLTTDERKALEEQRDKLRTNFDNIDTHREAISAQIHVNVSNTNLDTSSWGADNKIQQISRLQDPNSQRVNNAVSSNVVSLSDNNRFIGADAERRAIAQRKAERAARFNGENNIGSIFYVEDFSELAVQNTASSVLNPNDMVILPPNELSPTIVDPDVGGEGAVSKGRSYFSAIANQIFGTKGQLISLDMSIRGDPYWLGEPNVDNRLKGYQLGDEPRPADSRDITGGDALAVITFAFPQKYDDGGPLDNDDSFAGTGMTDINRKQNGFNGVYYIRAVESSFSNGLFTQKLIGHADPLTQEQDVIEFISLIESGSSTSGESALEKTSANTPNTDTNLNTRDTDTGTGRSDPLLTQAQSAATASIPKVPANLNLVTQVDAAKLQGTDPELATKAMQTLQEAREQGLDVSITEGYRSLERQAQLYAQGRTTPGNIVTNARAGQSKHNSGKAVDFGVFDNGKYVTRGSDPRYNQLGAIGKAQGLKWGGDFKNITDKPHFELIN